MSPERGGPTLLAFELATEACSVALLHDGALIARHAIAPRRHVELALPWADALLAEAGVAKAQLDALAVGVGPGAFTGVRLAISLVQGIALGLDRPVLPVSTLAALAAPFVAEGRVLATIDARMGELYVGEFERDPDGLPRAVADEVLLPLDAACGALALRWSRALAGASATVGTPRHPVSRIGVGTGFMAGGGAWIAPLADRFARIDAAALPSASAVARIAARDVGRGLAVSPERLEPTYLRDKVALTSAEQSAARAAKPG
ncbi:MAG TPA: tRNA (adenosine(37)-N6)-threonylcarbamoyltransferase complex dimerization subunit type 1 TsaB [Xanthomonadaceae bacterium]|jgi:tRNA threonylcarbamoyladenosine biosynthesis protein TsaB|nr:tRNA (adenosine(37)-N6)-threonylcarbamoyltransferase complex dimerization subunit type 1 TsaB [Xanthomonadaceae bacterium]